MDRLTAVIDSIEPLDAASMLSAKKHWDSIGKPLGSLGQLEDILIRIAGISCSEKIDIKKRALVVMCADNGVVAEGVSQTGQEVTAIVAENFLDNKTCTSIMCERTNTAVFPIDIGMAADTPRVEKHKIAYGTNNMAKGSAMTRQQAIDAIMVGVNKAKELYEAGYRLLATGEMGIGNTTTSSAIAAVFLECPVCEVTGRGAGLSGDGLKRKIEVIEKAIRLNRPDRNDPLDVLSKVGGFDIAGLVGVFIGGAAYRLPVIADGFISITAALIAVKLAPCCSDYIFASHASKEPAAARILEQLNKTAPLMLDMHLGEGSGAIALLSLIDMAVDIYYKMSTFEEINVTAYKELK